VQTIQQLNITPIGAPQTRSYDGGLQQAFFSERLILHATYFHNEFGRQIESVGVGELSQLLPQLTPPQLLKLENSLSVAGAFSLDLNSGAYSAQGAESEVEFGIGHSIFLRGGHTYLDAKVQHSFSSDALGPTYNTGLFEDTPPSFSGIPIGIYSPLRGARPFRRPPHTGFATASYSNRKWSAEVTGSFASRSDDSTFLGYSDIQGGNSLILPNRNLDHGFADVDAGGSYQLLNWLTVFVQGNNLLSNQHIAPIGYPSLPLNFLSGVKLVLGRTTK
jgi:iron complex outermembrane receptor protein/vitamin B12 transporter